MLLQEVTKDPGPGAHTLAGAPASHFMRYVSKQLPNLASSWLLLHYYYYYYYYYDYYYYYYYYCYYYYYYYYYYSGYYLRVLLLQLHNIGMLIIHE